MVTENVTGELMADGELANDGWRIADCECKSLTPNPSSAKADWLLRRGEQHPE